MPQRFGNNLPAVMAFALTASALVTSGCATQTVLPPEATGNTAATASGSLLDQWKYGLHQWTAGSGQNTPLSGEDHRTLQEIMFDMLKTDGFEANGNTILVSGQLDGTPFIAKCDTTNETGPTIALRYTSNIFQYVTDVENTTVSLEILPTSAQFTFYDLRQSMRYSCDESVIKKPSNSGTACQFVVRNNGSPSALVDSLDQRICKVAATKHAADPDFRQELTNSDIWPIRIDQYGNVSTRFLKGISF